ncbi:HAD family hydrolase [Alkalibacillus aidingensis]|uniref:HAD family hydrolase n=1 Tax=Alkalibacillus aidingensis TaxID=2747607 RepID=UPI001660433F|nr:HAD-IB family hydrolase [Alkalibacillus aidingensis]
MAVVTVDFDGTLYQGNSFKVMFQVARKEYGIKEWIVVGSGLLRSMFVGVFKGKEAFKHQFFHSFVRSFKGKSQEELASFFGELAREDLGRVNRPLVEKIKQHQSYGDDVVVLSGALMPFLKAFVKEIELENVETIGTQLVFDEDGICPGKMGRIVNGEEKVNQLHKWLKQHYKEQATETLYAYADSESDAPLLDLVDHPIVVNPGERMQKLATQKSWPVF